ncbi:DUF3576 domain-containing protein [Rickettsia typhi]|uniref:DUF3576 domain-containing protein n=2 Tax=Rickettsia typhi TaxID=785 RepID=Q68WV9_RICTY|nr:DUF3576 domain-containing protein [Rickettsia typhi]AAU03883.1 conserved hypothetical protein [Rickettsia typhi str. Wilmington]AFE54265.1 hypothetical protein RTTH1527_02000 [Rickettsia typhi str. TH1527]AFE55105.1 hypothetical protein RTB9991CWPP_02010 [Rickettsia typhi str. B9991CWPP]
MKKIIGLFVIILLVINISILAYDYPKAEQEQKWDEVGSIAGESGLVFRPGRVKNESTKAVGGTVNKYLWQAALEIISFIPLASVDSNGGVIITEWYSPRSNTNFRFKINIFIKDDVISPDAIEVKIFEEMLKNKQWILNENTSNFAIMLEDKILRKARGIYINSVR